MKYPKEKNYVRKLVKKFTPVLEVVTEGAFQLPVQYAKALKGCQPYLEPC